MALEADRGEFRPESVVEFMVRGKEEWDRISTFIQWVLPVSYTHLDVYKRQC